MKDVESQVRQTETGEKLVVRRGCMYRWDSLE